MKYSRLQILLLRIVIFKEIIHLKVSFNQYSVVHWRALSDNHYRMDVNSSSGSNWYIFRYGVHSVNLDLLIPHQCVKRK